MKLPQGIHFRLLVLGVLPATLLAFSLTFWFIQARINELDDALSARGKIIVKNLAPASIYGIFSGSDYLLQRLTDNLISEPDIVEVAIYNEQGTQRARSAKGAQTGTAPASELSYFSYPVELTILRDEESDPFSTLAEVVKEEKRRIGEVKVTLSRAKTLASQEQIIYTSLFITSLGLLFSLLLAYRLSSRISQPIVALTRTVKQVAEGDLAARSDVKALEELNELASGLNIMAKSLEENQSDLQEKIRSATIELNHSLRTLEKKNSALDNARLEAEKSNRQKSQFLAHMSHEIRTPMNGILGFLRLLGSSSLSPTQSNQLELIETSANNLLIIINEILDHAELESGHLKLSYSDFDLRRSIEETIALLAPLAHEKGLKLLLLVDEVSPKHLHCDPVRLRQVLFNLIGNAIKFSPSGRIIVRVRVGSEKENRSLLFTISDQGGGIPDNEQTDLFAPFVQAETADELPSPGTGLGLNIAQSIINALGGEIGFASKKSIGSTFWFTLPYSTSQSASKAQGNKSSPVSDASLSPPKQALLIDGCALSSQALLQQLKSVNCIATEIDLERFVKLIDSHGLGQYDCLIINLDNQFSIEVLNNLAEKHALPLLIVSHSPQQTAHGDVHQLQLPTTQTALLESLHYLIDNPLSQPSHHPAPKANNLSQPQLKFLVADDIEINRLLLIEQIKPHWNCAITEAEDGEEALERLREENFDLVFLDLRMPKRNGLSTLKALKSSTDALNQETPFIAITAYLPEDSEDELMRTGFSEIMIKPITENNLVASVGRLLKQNHTQTEQQSDNSDCEHYPFFDALVRKVNGDLNLAGSLLQKLNIELPEQMKSAQAAFERGALNDAQEAVHRIHGSACYFEITALSEIAKRIETALSHSNIEKTADLLPILAEEVARFIDLSKKAVQKIP